MLKYFVLIIFMYAILCIASAQNIYGNKESLQQDEYRAISWDVDQGLSMGSVTCMIKDINGFLWIGTTAGLNRFDGSRFIKYFADKNKSGTLNNDCINAMVQDSLHNIWIGTRRGLSRYVIEADTFANLSPPIDTNALDPYILPFWSTGNEVFCIEKSTQITSYDIHSFKRKVVVEHFQNDWDFNARRPASSVLDTTNNSVWMLAKAGLLEVSLISGKQTAYSFPCIRKSKFEGYIHSSWSMCFDAKRNSIWLNTTDGLVEFSISDKKFLYIHAFDTMVNEKPPKQTPHYLPLGGIGLDLEDRIWLGTIPHGIFIYDPQSNVISQPIINNTQANVLHSTLRYFDRDGIVWTSSKGIYQLNPISLAVTHYVADTAKKSFLSNNHVATMVEGPQHKIWMGTWDGINIFDPVTDSFEILREKDLPGFHGKNIMPLAMDSSFEKTWLKASMTPDALYEMDIPTKKCKLLKVNDTTSDHRVDLDNMEAEMARSYKNGFIFLMQGIGFFSVKKDSLIAQPTLSFSQNVSRIVMTHDHLLFLRTPNSDYNHTYIEKNGKWTLISNPLDSVQWSNIFFSTDDNTWWIGTEKELIHYDKGFHVIRRYADALHDIAPLSIEEDNYGDIWFISGSSTISKLDVKKEKFFWLSEKDGMPEESFNWENAALKDAYGNIYFGSGDGFYKINPDKFKDYYPPSLIYIQSISINGKSFTLSTAANYVQQLTLDYNENNISIKTGIIDFYSDGISHIRYKLDRGTNGWQYSSNDFTINLNRLSPGKYQLIIQASNALDDFNGPEKKMWIYIQSPWWDSWWFRGIAILLTCIIFYGVIRWQLHRKFLNQMLQSKQEKEISELKNKATELEMQTLRSQMNPHFIFNCLSSINRFILKNKTEEASDYLTKFSRLIRMVLNNSKQSFISLEDELETLRLYLEMERLRFKNSFDYSFTYNNSVDVSNIFIPPLLLQPFAENAIWHGLMHKQEKGFLNFNFSVEEKFLNCTITDNGIGREQAELLKSKSVEKQKSLGLKITTERLSLLNNDSDQQTFFTIEDLIDKNGNASGTRVHLKIFYKEMMEV